jgi:hypothetical protein
MPTVRFSPTWVDAGLHMPFTEQWNLALEREFPKRLSISVSYTGNRGIGLLLYDTANRIFLPGAGYQGDLGRNTFFAHGSNNTDMQLSKAFRIREGHELSFRMEFYNMFNRVQWGYPNQSGLNAESSFLQITGQRNGPRTGQFVIRYVF